MSLTTKQINELRSYAADRKGELAKLINAAADTIEEFNNSIKNLRIQLRTQSRWIPCDDCERKCDKWENSKT